MTLKRVNRCQFCGKSFVRKSWFLRHTCAKKRKFEETNDVITLHAFRVYVYWMRSQNLLRRNKEPDINKFLKSPYKKNFVALIMFCREQGISSPYSYIDWLIKTKTIAGKWTDATCIDRYQIYAKSHEDPEDQAIRTFDHIERWLFEDLEHRTIEQFFEDLTPGVILSWVHQRKIKPWVLFTYEPISSRWLGDEFYNPEVFYQIDDIVNCEYWAEKIDEFPEASATVFQIMDQLWVSPT